MADIEERARLTIDCGRQIHKDPAPGLLESACEAMLASSRLRVNECAPIQVADLGG